MVHVPSKGLGDHLALTLHFSGEKINSQQVFYTQQHQCLLYSFLFKTNKCLEKICGPAALSPPCKYRLCFTLHKRQDRNFSETEKGKRYHQWSLCYSVTDYDIGTQ